jgi:hypothetical protein
MFTEVNVSAAVISVDLKNQLKVFIRGSIEPPIDPNQVLNQFMLKVSRFPNRGHSKLLLSFLQRNGFRTKEWFF